MMRRRTVVITILLLAGLALANLGVAALLPERWDLTRQGNFTLSAESRNLLENLTAPVEITILASHAARTGGDRKFDESSRGLLRELLELYRRAQPRLQVRELDPQADAAALQLQQQFPDVTIPCVIVTYGEGTSQRHEVLSPRDLLRERAATEERPGSVEFLGEQGITAALKRLSSGRKQTVVCVLTGHGELSLTDTQSAAPRGLTALAGRLRDLDCDLRPLDLRTAEKVPAEADLLLVAGPDQPLSPEEAQKLRVWLTHGGRAILLFDLVLGHVAGTTVTLGWEELLEEHGLQLGNDRILTKSFQGTLDSASPGLPAATEHPLVQALPKSPVLLFDCRSVQRINSVRQLPIKMAPLLVSYRAPDAWAEGDLRPQSLPHPGGTGDLDGPVSMAVAVERLEGGTEGVPRPALVVVGDAEFASNRALSELSGQNGFRFLLSSLNWLRGRRDLLADIRPQVRSAYRLSGNEAAHRRLVWVPSLFLMLTLITSGSTVWFVRRQG